MKPSLEAVLLGGVCCAAIAFMLVVACGSQPVPLTALQQTEVASYAGQEMACVTDSASRVQADQCIAAVRAQWCSPGAPLQVQAACGDAGISSVSVGPTLGKLLDKVYPPDAALDAGAVAQSLDGGGQ